MKPKLISNIAIVIAVGMALKVFADECNSDQYTVGPDIQDAECAVGGTANGGCVSITISPSYYHVCTDDYCTESVFTGSGPNVITITQTTVDLTCTVTGSFPDWELVCAAPVKSTTNSTYTVKQPLNFLSCNCPG